MINVSPDNLPLDIELEDANDLAAVIRAVCECDMHAECQESPLNIKFVGVDHSNPDSPGKRLFSIDDIPNGSIDPTATPLMNKLQRECEKEKSRLWSGLVDGIAGSGQAANPTPNVVTEQRRDWVRLQLDDWCVKAPCDMGETAFNMLVTQVDEMIALGQWAPQPTTVSISPGWNRFEIAEKQLTEMGWVFDAIGKRWVHPVDPTEQLAQEYEKREILENQSAVGYMRQRINQLEAEKQHLAQELGKCKAENSNLNFRNSNQHGDITKWFDMMTTWGWDEGEPHEWLKVYVETLISNAQKATADANELGNRLNMRNGELQAALDLKNELIEENKKSVEENSLLRQHHARISDEREGLQASLARRDRELFSARKEQQKLENKVKRLNARIKNLQ